jgi:lipopolysaccharide transport system permease protein
VRDLLFELVRRDVRLRYKRSAVGLAWSILNPLAQFLILRFVFGVMIPLDIPQYSSFLVTGVLAWNWFHAALVGATGAIVDNRDLVRRPGFPVATLPAVTVTSHLVHFLIALPILLVFLVLDGGALHAPFAALPLVVALQFLLTLGLAYMLGALQVTFRDTQYLVGIALQLLFFLTPIFYDASVVPARYQPLFRWNPIAVLVGAYRDVLIAGRSPAYASLAVVSIVALSILAFGWAMFRRASGHFAEEL